MRRSRIRTISLVLIPSLCAVAIGCGTQTPKKAETPRKSSSTQALPPIAPHAAPAELLAKSRPELASLYEETAAQVQNREKAHRDGTLVFGLLPRLRLPLIVPIWAEASYSTKSKISLPPYVPENAKDSRLALHLARLGDVEAARALVEDDDAGVGKEIDGLAYERNYPAEWTRLMSLMVHTAEYRLAGGDDEARAELASLHKQLREILDAKAAKGPLGAVLLSQGRKVLALAAAEWRDTGHPNLADKADDDLAAWGEFPAPAIAVPFGASSKSVAAMLRSQAHGRAVVALNYNRALDVLELPVTSEGAQGVTAIFDAEDKLAEVLVSYRAGIADYYLEPANLVTPLEDHDIAGKNRAEAGSVHRRDYRLGKSFCEVSVVPRGYVMGAFVRFIGEKRSAAALSRDFGPVNLDRTFGQNRVRLVPEKVGDTVQTSRGPTLAKIANPLAPLAPATAVLQRDGWQDLVKSFTMIYNVDENTPPLFQTALPLWSAFGPADIEALEDKEGGFLVLTWKDARTQYALHMPHLSGRQFEFEVTDPRGREGSAARAAAAAELDAADRKNRLERKQPLIRIPRRVDIGLAGSPSGVSLEMTREQVAAILPQAKSVVTQNGPDFVNVLLTGDPPKSAARTTRQVFIRFGPDQKVAEMRTRTVAGPGGASSHWISDMLAGLGKICGAPLESQPSWPTVWSDLPARKPAPLLGRWQDDVAWMTVQRDGTTVEMIVHDCPLEHRAGVPLPPFAYLPRGPEGLALGDSRDDVIKRLNVGELRTLDDGGLVLPPARAGTYDALIVWFEKDRVSRIVARVPAATVQPGKKPPTAADQITHSWGRNLRSLGWPTRQDSSPEGSLQTLGWHDDVTRVRIFAQDSEDGIARVFTEWKDLSEMKAK